MWQSGKSKAWTRAVSVIPASLPWSPLRHRAPGRTLECLRRFYIWVLSLKNSVLSVFCVNWILFQNNCLKNRSVLPKSVVKIKIVGSHHFLLTSLPALSLGPVLHCAVSLPVPAHTIALRCALVCSLPWPLEAALLHQPWLLMNYSCLAFCVLEFLQLSRFPQTLPFLSASCADLDCTARDIVK